MKTITAQKPRTARTGKHASRAAATVAALAVACALCPAIAHADEALALTASPAAAEQALQTQASSKTKVYVVSKISGNGKTFSYAYNKNGLVKRMISGGAKTTYKYSGTKLKSFDSEAGRNVVKYKNGKAVKVARAYGSGYYDTWSYDKKGRVTKYASHTPLGTGKIVYTYSKNGRIAKASSAFGAASPDIIRPTYDKKGNVTSWSGRSFKISYNKSGRATARTISSSGTEKFTYKRISIPKKYLKAVKAQQRCVLNRSFGIGSYQARLFD